MNKDTGHELLCKSQIISTLEIPQVAIKKFISIITLCAFIFTNCGISAVWAARTPADPTRVGSASLDGPVLSAKVLRVDSFAIPDYLGTIKDSFRSTGSDKIIVHIQDAHANYACQSKISDIIKHINKEYRLGLINLEGGAKDYDLAIFTSIQDKAKRELVSDSFVKEGLINGAEFYAINNPENSTLWGIEDVGLYMENLNVYRNSLAYKKEVDSGLKSIKTALSMLKAKIYSKELLEMDMNYSAYKEGNMEFKAYLSYLIKEAKEKNIDIKAYTAYSGLP